MQVLQEVDIDSYTYDSELDISAYTTSSGYGESMEQRFDISRDFRSSSPVPNFTFTVNSDASSPKNENDRTPGMNNSISSQHNPFSPPYKTVRALRLFDCPFTPKTLFEKSSVDTPATPSVRSKLFSRLEKPRGVPCAYPKLDKPSANVNPFTPTGMQLMSKKRTRSKRSLVG
jgi:wee1-like protein kinase